MHRILTIGEGRPIFLECNSSGKVHLIESFGPSRFGKYFVTQCGIVKNSKDLVESGYGWVLHLESSRSKSTCKRCNIS
jgi:hypothetical protein